VFGGEGVHRDADVVDALFAFLGGDDDLLDDRADRRRRFGVPLVLGRGVLGVQARGGERHQQCHEPCDEHDSLLID